MEYTKGEWKVGWGCGLTGPTTQAVTPVCGGTDWPVLPVSIGQETIAICPAQDLNRTRTPDKKEMEANAQLIASAPNLYEAAKEVMDTLEQYGGSIVPHLMDTDDNAGQRLREAIAKAKGK